MPRRPFRSARSPRRPLGAARGLALDVSPLRESVPYRALWIGQIVSLLGSQIRYIAVPYQVFQLTGSVLAGGMIGLAEVVPLIAFSILGGAWADRTDRRALVAKTQIAMMASSLALAAVTFAGEPSVPVIYALTAVASVFNSIDRPARSAMIPSMVAPGKIAAAMALRQVVFQVTQIVGPLVGGVLIAGVGIGWAYVVDALTFVAALVALRWVPPAPPEGAVQQRALEAVREGLRFSFRTPFIASIFVIDLVAMIFGMPRAVFPALAERTFDGGAATLSLLYASVSIGALVGALTSGWVTRVRSQGVAVLVAVTIWGAAITLAGLSLFSLVLTMTFLAVAGAADVISAVFRGTMLQENTPDALRGRVTAVNLMVVTGGPRLGDVEAGIAASLVGAPASVVVGGIACLLGTAGVAAAFPSLRAYRRRP
ncbi:MAG TPA: MFS transporter [Actinomycetota bacterium]|nr:MFS transporter [Actinomycetota bacterium]